MGRNKNGKWGFLRHLSIFQGVKIKTFKKKYIFSCHDEDNDKSSREKIVLDFSSKFNRSISALCVTKTIAKKGEIFGAIRAMVQTRGRFFVENPIPRKKPNPEDFQKSLTRIPSS